MPDQNEIRRREQLARQPYGKLTPTRELLETRARDPEHPLGRLKLLADSERPPWLCAERICVGVADRGESLGRAFHEPWLTPGVATGLVLRTSRSRAIVIVQLTEHWHRAPLVLVRRFHGSAAQAASSAGSDE